MRLEFNLITQNALLGILETFDHRPLLRKIYSLCYHVTAFCMRRRRRSLFNGNISSQRTGSRITILGLESKLLSAGNGETVFNSKLPP